MFAMPIHPIAVFTCLIALSAQTVNAEPADQSDQNKSEQTASESEADQNPMTHTHTNKLINATSPYLLQHAHNPVDWHEWGDTAFAKATSEDKPIFLSIGYAACHWCHVMEHESFEVEEVADILNEHFVSIKVDREERPDIDEIYMQATVAMTGHGGWPMSVFMTPDAKPFHTGTYFPKQQFMGLLQSIASVWESDRDRITRQGDQMRQYLQQWATLPSAGDDVISELTITDTATLLLKYFDRTQGGMSGGGSNKFPPSMAMDLMLRAYHRQGDPELLDAVDLTLRKMARGGIYDQLGGGICRYSTDPKWLVPHFEKMLYDQGLVGAIYVDGFQVTGDALYEETARGIFDYVIRDLQSPAGGFYSTRDADSEGIEGKFYVWTKAEVEAILDAEDAKVFCAYFDVTDSGNWNARGHGPTGPINILNIPRDPKTVAREFGLDIDEFNRRIDRMKSRMYAEREKRVHPGLDDKILTGWNGLMITALAKGAQVFDEPRYADAAERAADFVLKNLHRDGKLLRTWRHGDARLTGYLTDYAFFVEGLLHLYESTFDPRRLREAIALTDNMIERYHDDKDGAFYFTASDGEELITRTKDPRDGAIPSGNSVAAMNLLRLYHLTGNTKYRENAESIFKVFAPLTAQSASSFERLMCAVDFYHGTPREIVIAGPLGAPETHALIRTLHATYLPNKIVTLVEKDPPPEPLVQLIPLLKGKKPIDGKPAAYVCRNRVCKKPVTSVAELTDQLRAKP
jgi:hypothetical protein